MKVDSIDIVSFSVYKHGLNGYLEKRLTFSFKNKEICFCHDSKNCITKRNV